MINEALNDFIKERLIFIYDEVQLRSTLSPTLRNETTILPRGGLRLRLSLVLVHVDGGPCRCILAPSSRRQRESTLQRRLSNAIKVSSFNHSPLLSNVEDRFGNLEYGFCVSSVAGYRQISPRVKSYSYYTLSSLQRHSRKTSGISAKTVDAEWRSWHRCVVSTLPPLHKWIFLFRRLPRSSWVTHDESLLDPLIFCSQLSSWLVCTRHFPLITLLCGGVRAWHLRGVHNRECSHVAFF